MCCFLVEKVKFLRHIITKDGIPSDPSKISAIKALTAPCDVSGVRRILGMINHVARFVSHLSMKIERLRALLSKNVEFQLKDHHEEVLKEITDIKYSLL